MPKRDRKLTSEQEEEEREQAEEDEIIEKWEEEHPEVTEEPQEEEETEETEPQKPTEEQREKWRKEERKEELLDELERQLEESGKSDVEIAELKKQFWEEQMKLTGFWQIVIENKNWEGILRTYFGIINGMTNKMCAKTVIAVTEKDGKITFIYEFFDENGKPVITEFNKVEGDND